MDVLNSLVELQFKDLNYFHLYMGLTDADVCAIGKTRAVLSQGPPRDAPNI